MKFQHITGAGNTQYPGKYPHIPGNDEISPAFGKIAVMGVFVENRPVGGAEILRPLVLNVNEGPLPAAELEMLQTGELEEVLLGVDYPSTLQVTPSGRLASSTVMV